MANIEGICREEFHAVREVFEYHLDSGIATGASVAVFIDGEPVVDLWGGYFDATYTRPSSRDSVRPACRRTPVFASVVDTGPCCRGTRLDNSPKSRFLAGAIYPHVGSNAVSPRFSKPGAPPQSYIFAPPVGIEPTTDRLEGCCSIL